MASFAFELAGLRSGQITADSMTTTDAGALVFIVGGEPVAIFAARSWVSVFADGAQILWVSAAQPGQPAQPDKTPAEPRFGTYGKTHQREH
jgi:hypothetical protein